jgi:hypothetical protein
LEESEEADLEKWKKKEEKCQIQQMIKRRRFGLFEGGRRGRSGKKECGDKKRNMRKIM